MHLYSKLWSEPNMAAAPTVVIVHGLFGASDNLGGVARELARNRPVIGLDLRNHGRSPHVEGMSMGALAEDIIETLDALQVPRAVFLGHSLGGKVCMQLAMNYPERVQGLVVADIAPVDYPDEHMTIINAMQQLPLAELSSRADADRLLAKHIPETHVRQFLLTNLLRQQGGYSWRLNLSAIAAGYKDIRKKPSATRAITASTLFIKGANSNYIQKRHLPEMARYFPNYQLQTIENAGHWLHVEQSDIFNAMVSTFISELK